MEFVPTHLVPQATRSLKRNLLDQQTPEIALGQSQPQILTIRIYLGECIRLEVFEDSVVCLDLVDGLGEECSKAGTGKEVD